MNEKPPALPALTGLRSILALLVVCSHFAPGVLSGVSYNGYVAVNVFFLLSGFVLAYSYLTPEGTVRNGARFFYRARIARIYPAYLVGMSLGLYTLLRWPPPLDGYYMRPFVAQPMRILLACLLALQSWVPNWAETINPPAWSLSTEAAFYLAFPLLASLLWRVRQPLRVAGICYGLALLPGAIAWLFGPQHGALGQLFSTSPLIRQPEFACGIALGVAYLRPHRSAPAWLTPAAALVLVAALVAGPRLPFPLLHSGLLDPVCAAVLWSLADRCRGWLAHPLPVLLGEASYGLYILHWPLWVLWANLSPVPGGLAAYLHFGAYVIGAVAISVGLHLWFERPVRRAIMLWPEGTRVPSAVTHAAPPVPAG
jgi:peptidoglycan/LPS O-acetylase OafA/YrhL